MHKRPGQYSPATGKSSSLGRKGDGSRVAVGSRPNAVFEYVGEAMGAGEARALLDGSMAEAA